MRHVYRDIQRLLTAYKDEKKGPTYIAVQSSLGMESAMQNRVTFLAEMKNLPNAKKNAQSIFDDGLITREYLI